MICNGLLARRGPNTWPGRWTIALSLALTLESSVAVAGPVVRVETGPGHLNGVALCQFEDDSMTLIVNEGDKELTRQYFCSSYGKASARIIQDVRGESFVLVTYAEGRGTNATTEYLSVYHLAKNLVEYLRTPVSAAAGSQSRWYYDPRIEPTAHGGIRLVLSLRVEGEAAGWLPSEKTRVIELGVGTS